MSKKNQNINGKNQNKKHNNIKNSPLKEYANSFFKDNKSIKNDTKRENKKLDKKEIQSNLSIKDLSSKMDKLTLNKKIQERKSEYLKSLGYDKKAYTENSEYTEYTNNSNLINTFKFDEYEINKNTITNISNKNSSKVKINNNGATKNNKVVINKVKNVNENLINGIYKLNVDTVLKLNQINKKKVDSNLEEKLKNIKSFKEIKGNKELIEKISQKNLILLIIFISTVIVAAVIAIQMKAISFIDIKKIEAMRDAELKTEITALKEKNKELDSRILEIDNNIQKYKLNTTENKSTSEIIENELLLTNINAGYTNVTGEGLILTLEDNEAQEIDSADILNLVNQLWIAGAEAISINDERVVSSTDITTVDQNKVFVNSKHQAGPYKIKVIGNKKQLEGALIIKNGYINEMLATGKSISYTIEENIEIPKYKSEIEMKIGN